MINHLRSHSVDVLVVTAAKGEDTAVRSVRSGLVGLWTEVEADNKPNGFPFPLWRSRFEYSTKSTIEVILARAPDQREHAASGIAAPLISHFNPYCIAMCGVCAGRPGEVNLGDVIIADKVWKYDAGEIIRAGFGRAERRPEIETYQLPKHWKLAAESFSCALPDESWKSERPIGPHCTPWRVLLGGIATGRDLVRDATIWDRLAKTQNRKILGIEMEASAIGWVAEAYDVRRKIIVKAAMDHGDPSKSDKCRRFAAHAAAEVMIAFLRGHLDNHNEQPWSGERILRDFDEVDSSISVELLKTAVQGSRRDNVVERLISHLASEPGPGAAERYWIYVTLAKIGGPAASQEIARGLADPDPLARSGAAEGIQILNNSRIRMA